MSVKTATGATRGIVKGSAGIKVAEDGSIDVNTLFTQAAELANIIAGEAISTALGKISKSIEVTMGLNENALLKSMLKNMDINDSTKINSAAFVHTLVERIGMGTELSVGENLTDAVNKQNSNLTELNNRLILRAGCKYMAVKQYSLANTGSNSWVNIGLSALDITGKKLPDYCIPMACISWNTGASFWVTYCHRVDETTLQVGFNTAVTRAFRVTLIFGLVDA